MKVTPLPAFAVGAIAALSGMAAWNRLSPHSESEAANVNAPPVPEKVTSAEIPAVDWVANAHRLTMPSRREYTLPLNNPDVVPASSATHMQADDLVVGITLHGSSRAYPWWILSNYHVVNDTMITNTHGTLPVYIGLCEQCSGAAAFSPIIDELPERPLIFQVSGISAGTIQISDVQTLSQWHPFSGEAISGPLKGRTLEPIPYVLERWDIWVQQHGDSDVVLGSLQMRRRPHGMSHGALIGHPYLPDFFAEVANLTDKRLPANELVYGLVVGTQGAAIAVRHGDLSKNGFLEIEFKNTPLLLRLVGEYGVRAFVREVDGIALNFTPDPENPLLLKDQFGSVWNEMGEAIGGRHSLAKARLRLARGYLTEWYEWVSNEPETEVYNPARKAALGIPELAIYDGDGKPFPLSNLKGSHSVLVFGCATSPSLEATSAELEAVFRDYRDRGVKFFLVYKTLANPGRSGFVSPVDIKERVLQMQHAREGLGLSIPWLCDNMANDFVNALAAKANTEVIVDASGNIVQIRDWLDPTLLRRDLAQLVGPVDNPTKASDIRLKIGQLVPSAPKNVLPPIDVPYPMIPLKMRPHPSDRPLLVKLVAEAESGLLTSGSGKLYLGFHLDPIYGVYWNNALPKLSYEVVSDEGVSVTPPSGQAPDVGKPRDIDPREFLLIVDGASEDSRFRVNVSYVACNDKIPFQEAITQSYDVGLVRDPVAGKRAPRLAPQYREGDLVAKFMEDDKDASGGLSQTEMPPSLRNNFQQLDANRDGQISAAEMKPVEDQLLKQQDYHW